MSNIGCPTHCGCESSRCRHNTLPAPKETGRAPTAGAAITKAPLGQENTGLNPTDRAKSPTKRSIQTEAAGVPVGLAVGGAHVHDKHLLEPTLEHSETLVPVALQGCEQEHPCLDENYDSPDVGGMGRFLPPCDSSSSPLSAIIQLMISSVGTEIEMSPSD